MAIVDKDGRPRSVRTTEEEHTLLLEDLGKLPLGEQAALMELFEQLHGEEDSAKDVLKAEYAVAPVDIATFLTDPHFLGETGRQLYPQLFDDLVDLFGGNYTEACLGGALGYGKSYFATTAMAYVLYQMSCLRSPQKAYGIDPGSHIYIAMMSVTEKVARRVVINELLGKIGYSRYFKEQFPFKAAPSQLEIRFPNSIQVVAGSTGSSAIIGLNVYSAFVDESSFMGDTTQIDRHGRLVAIDQGEAIYKSIIRRMKSRFQRVGRLPGVLVVTSSKERPSAFIEKRIQQAKDENDKDLFVREYCLTGDTTIPLLNGSEETIAKLAETVGDGEIWVYSMDVTRGMVVSGRAHHIKKTKENEPIVAVKLDTGEVVRCTATHPFMMMSGKYKRAIDLEPGDSLMPLRKRLDENGYEELQQPWWGGHKSPNHSVVSVEACGTADVYDMSVDEYENFAVGAGVFVHNSTWDVKPSEQFSEERFKVVVGNDRVQSRILLGDDPEEETLFLDMGLQVVEIPVDYREEFERDIDGALRDVAGVATESVSNYIQRTDKIFDSETPHLPSPVENEVWVANSPLEIRWGLIAKSFQRRLPGGYEEVAWKPIRHPNATRYVHIDPSLTGDCTGFAMGHIASWTEVVRKVQGEEYVELAPVIETDLLLRIQPPPGDEILLSDVRSLIYQFQEHGFNIGYVSQDQFQSADSLQQLRKRGIEAELASVDRTTEPYDVLKTALYESRVHTQRHMWLYTELRNLQRVPKGRGKTKIDHPKKMTSPDGADTAGSKDLADALAGVVYSLTMRTPGQPIPPMLGLSVTAGADVEKPDHSWVSDGKVMVEPRDGKRGGPSSRRVGEQPSPRTAPMPFTKG
jgi:hypothetical protein